LPSHDCERTREGPSHCRMLERDDISSKPSSCSNALNSCGSDEQPVRAFAGHALGWAEAMWHDELNAPLGQDPVRERQSRGKTFVLAGFFGGGILAVAFVPFVHSVLEQTRPPAPAFDGADFSARRKLSRQSPHPAPGNRPPQRPGSSSRRRRAKQDPGSGCHLQAHLPGAQKPPQSR
jgi:hypothetical protein